MKKGIIILFFTGLLIVSGAKPQSPVLLQDSVSNSQREYIRQMRDQINSLQRREGEAGDDSSKVNLMNKLAQLYVSFSYDTAVAYSLKALSLAEQIDYPRGEVIAIMERGNAEETIRKNWDTAIICYRHAIDVARKNKLDNMLDNLYGVIHNAYVYQGNFPLAMMIANTGLEAAKKRNDSRQILHYSSLVAASYFRQDLYDKALAEFKKAEEIALQAAHDERSFLNLVTIADIHYGMGDVYRAMGDTANAFYYLEKALEKFTSLCKDSFFIRHYMIPNTLYKTGLAKKKAGNLREALQFGLAAVDSARRISCNLYEKANYYFLAGDVLRLMGRQAEARKYLYEGTAIAEEIRHAENMRDGYYFLSFLFADEKKFDSAWYYSRLYIFLKDSITNERTRFLTDDIKRNFDLAEKDRQIARQNNLRNILIASFLVLLLSLGFLYNRYRLRQRNRYQQELNRQQNDLFNAIALAQEQERKRIAQDIHDSLGSVLSAAKLKLAEVKDNKPELGADEKFLSGINLLDEASGELRNISHNIMPATLSKLGLVPALKNLTEKISSHKGLQVSFIVHEFEKRLDEQTEISVYRIILELINNVVKHAAATKATVQLVRYPDHINITVEDNGKGFDIGRTVDEKPGIGLGSVTARVEYLKGTMDIDSVPDKGTTVIVDIPVGA